MYKTIILLASCLFLVSPALADEGRYRGAWADYNYTSLLLFDSLSGRLMDIVVPQTHETPFQLREQGVPSHITEMHYSMTIKRPSVPMKPGETNIIQMKILGVEFVRPKFVADYSVSMRNGEFTGGSCFIWNIDEWKAVPEELNKQKQLLLFSRGQEEATRYDGKPIPAGNRILLDSALYNRLATRLATSSPEPFHAPKFINEANKFYRKTRLELARHEDGRLKTSSSDYAFEMLLNRDTGDLAVYLRYRNHEEPKDLDVSEIRAMIAPDQLAAAPWNYWVDTTVPRDRKIVGAKTDDKSESAGDGSGGGEDSRFTIRVNQVFGTVRPIWELAIWPELGRRIREGGNAYLLYFNDEDVQDLKKPEISQSYLVVTADLYAAMDAMRQTAEKERKLTDEREALKGMMSE